MCVQSCPTLCNIMDCSHPLHQWDFPGKKLEWVAMSFSRGFSQPRDQTQVSCGSYIGRQILYHWATWEALNYTLFLWKYIYNNVCLYKIKNTLNADTSIVGENSFIVNYCFLERYIFVLQTRRNIKWGSLQGND